MTVLSLESLEFAKEHLQLYYDSDFFPKSDVFSAIWSQWEEVNSWLHSTNVYNQPVLLPRLVAAPKASGGYRVVHQLHPANAITYTAMAYMVAELVESSRHPSNVACSYRIELGNGSFFKAGNGYSTFISRCEELASQHSFVLIADISDFYNRLYLHRLNNALVHCSTHLQETAKSLEMFLTRLNDKASQGIPVGPAASMVFSEAVCHDIDEFIANRGFSHTRYVDDLRIFGNSSTSLEALTNELVLYLFSTHRLQFAWPKTFVKDCETFSCRYLNPPERVEQHALLGVARELSAYPVQVTDSDVTELAQKALQPEPPPIAPQVTSDNGFDSLIAALAHADRAERAIIREHGFGKLLAESLQGDGLDIGVARLALRRSRNLGVFGLGPFLMENLERFAPVCPDVFLYLQKAGAGAQVAEQVKARIKSGTLTPSPFVKHWFEWWISGDPVLLSDREIKAYALSKSATEHQLRAAATTNNLACVRSARASFSSLGSWDRRAALLAANILPSDERNAWLKNVPLNSSDPSEKWLVEYAKTGHS